MGSVVVDGMDLISVFLDRTSAVEMRMGTLLCEFHEDLCKVQDELEAMKAQIKQLKNDPD